MTDSTTTNLQRLEATLRASSATLASDLGIEIIRSYYAEESTTTRTVKGKTELLQVPPGYVYMWRVNAISHPERGPLSGDYKVDPDYLEKTDEDQIGREFIQAIRDAIEYVIAANWDI